MNLVVRHLSEDKALLDSGLLPQDSLFLLKSQLCLIDSGCKTFLGRQPGTPSPNRERHATSCLLFSVDISESLLT